MTESLYRNIPPELLEALLENPHESQILVDAQGIVRYMSRTNEDFYGVSRKRAIGRHILELNPQSELPRVLTTGRAEIGHLFRLKGKQRVIARIPLADSEGRIIGAVAKLMFWNPAKVKELVRQVEVLQGRLDYYEKELQQAYRSRYSLEGIVGESGPMQEAKQIALQAAASDLPVLIVGETGTGKELFAHAIHQLSARRERALVRVNCAAIPHELFESELFGYEAGAFTGASPKGKPGKFELADKSTMFLDEVGELPLSLQVKLLRVVQEREVERIGGTRTLKLDFRVIAATNRNLTDMLARREFRQDLYYRLNIFLLKTPPLRHIRADIPRLAYHVLSLIAAQDGSSRRIEPAAMAGLVAYDWPGNVRELRNVLERAASSAGEGPIREEHLPPEIRQGVSVTPMDRVPSTLKDELAEVERRAIRRALRVSGGNRTNAARLLGIHRTGLYQKMRQHGIGVREKSGRPG
ncbi:MAG TPA: sigma 54-interacting transcriptional regulator [Desulfomonilaceae bacterium]|nr:sigma 54-interacting transcriptional regulator [Desulfomonilaceae bacterium]